jgi:hypothetical protein
MAEEFLNAGPPVMRRIVEMASAQSGIPPEDLSATSDLRRDCGLYGGDALEFIQAFSREFNVDMAHFRFDDYFESEGYAIHLWRAVLGQSKSFTPLPISALVKIAKLGKWPASLGELEGHRS